MIVAASINSVPQPDFATAATDRQGRSGLGLGLSAQREAVARFIAAEHLELLSEHVEVETGKGADALERRPKLREAMEQARKAKASVVIAKLDRLSGNVAFISGLMNKHVPFIVAELGPTSNRSCCTFTLRWLRKSGR
jgi:DNA invertase Pin-like site-specific DNA recombinase